MTNPKIVSKTTISNQITNMFKDLYNVFDQQSHLFCDILLNTYDFFQTVWGSSRDHLVYF